MSVDTKTQGLLAHLDKGRDLVYFSEEILGIELNRAQRRWFARVASKDGWENKVVVHVAANQIGKTLGVAIILLWAGLYKVGVDRTDPEKWFASPYVWFHVAPTQQQAYLPLKDMSLIIQGVHPAQRKKCLLPREMVSAVKLEQYYDGLQFWNGAQIQFRTTEDKAKALQGRRAAGISYDECAFEDHLKSVVNETLMMRLISTGGPLLLVSTPNGINDYYEIVQSIIQTGTEIDDKVWTTDEGWAVVWSVITDNVGYGISADVVERMERDLDETTKEQQLRGAFLEPAEAFFTPTAPIVSAFKRLPEVVPPVAGHKYVFFWDPSVASDPTAVIGLDVTKTPWQGVYFKHYPKPLPITQLLMEIQGLHALYNSETNRMERSRAMTGYDATSMGGQMLRQQLTRITPSRPLNFGGPSTKINILTNLRAALAQGKVVIPESWTRLQREVLNYRLKDDKLAQDCVMALAGAVEIASKGFSGSQSRPFDVSGRVTQRAPWL